MEYEKKNNKNAVEYFCENNRQVTTNVWRKVCRERDSAPTVSNSLKTKFTMIHNSLYFTV